MGICITIRFEDTPRGFENYLRKFMTCYYKSVQIRFGDIEGIILDGSPTDGEEQTAWILLDAAAADYYEQQKQLV